MQDQCGLPGAVEAEPLEPAAAPPVHQEDAVPKLSFASVPPQEAPAMGRAAAAEASKSVSPQPSGRSPAVNEQAVVRVFNVSLWVRTAGTTLALCAGVVNAVSFHALGGFVSHQTGTLSKIGLGLEDSDVADAGASALLLLSFLTGSTTCGFLIAKDTVHFGLALYDMCLLVESALLVSAALLAEDDIARYLASAACGLQNGMATHWGGAVIRTTHVTGLFTDVGLLLGRMGSMLCRKRCGKRFDRLDRGLWQDDLSKLSVLLCIAAAYLVGIIVGALLYNEMEERAFLVPAGVTGCAGLAYSFYRVVALHQSLFSDAEMEAVDVAVDIVDLPRVQRESSASNRDSWEPSKRSASQRSTTSPVVAVLERETALQWEEDFEHGVRHRVTLQQHQQQQQ